MTYSKQTWANDAVGGTPLNATRLNYIEEGVFEASANVRSTLAAVRVATTADITLSGTQTIDGVSVSAGNRVLVKDQVLDANNGVYACAAGAWARTTDADTADELAGASVQVTEGTANGGTGWDQQTPAPIVLGATSITWALSSQSTGISDAAAQAKVDALAAVTLGNVGGERHTINSAVVLSTAPTHTTLNVSTANEFVLVLDRNVIFDFANFTNGVACWVMLWVYQDGTGGRTWSLPAGTWRGLAGAPTFSTAIGALEQVEVYSRDGGATLLYFYFGAEGVVTTTQTANYTLAAVDASTVLEMNKASAVTVTVPLNATVAFPVGTIIEVYQLGAGQVTVAGAGGVTLRIPNGAKTAQQYSTLSLRKRATDEWVVSGDTAV